MVVFREIYLHLDSFLADAAKEILENCPLLEKVCVEYFPQLGYLVAVDDDQSITLEYDKTFSFQFHDNQRNYFKNIVTHGI